MNYPYHIILHFFVFHMKDRKYLFNTQLTTNDRTAARQSKRQPNTKH